MLKKIIIMIFFSLIMYFRNRLFFSNFILRDNIYKFKTFTNNFYINSEDYNKLKISKKTLYIVTHDYEHIDVLSLNSLFSKNKKILYYFIVANAWWNKANDILFLNKNINSLFTGTGVVNKSIKLLNQNNNVVIFIYRHSNATGTFNIVKNSNCKVVLIKIKCRKKINKTHINCSKSELIFSYINEDFDIITHDFNHLPMNSSDYLKKIKYALYS